MIAKIQFFLIIAIKYFFSKLVRAKSMLIITNTATRIRVVIFNTSFSHISVNEVYCPMFTAIAKCRIPIPPTSKTTYLLLRSAYNIESSVCVGNKKSINSVEFTIKPSIRFQNNLQKILYYTLQEWGGRVTAEFYCEVIKQIELLKFFPKINSKNRFLESNETKEYRNIIFKNYPYVVTYSIQGNFIRIINIIHKKQSPKIRQQT